jgi:hypothetical protein
MMWWEVTTQDPLNMMLTVCEETGKLIPCHHHHQNPRVAAATTSVVVTPLPEPTSGAVLSAS